jgi:hypothetical protein
MQALAKHLGNGGIVFNSKYAHLAPSKGAMRVGRSHT